MSAACSDKRMMADRFRQFIQVGALAAIPLTTLCVFVPLQIYVGNPTEFTASFLEVSLAYVPYMLVLMIICGFVAALLNAAGNLRLISLLGATTCLLWLQANILVWDYGELDGRSIEWTAGVWRGVLDTTIWAGVILVSIFAYKRAGRLFLHASVAIFVVQLAATGLLLTSDNAVSIQNSDVEENQAGKDAILRFSSTKNVVHIVMDGFQADLFEQLLADPANADIRQQLQGFTAFRNNLGVFPYTEMTIPAMLSGRTYRNEMPVDKYLDQTLAGTTILNAASDAGFEVDIAAAVSLKHVYAKSRHGNDFGISSSGHVSAQDYVDNDAARLADLSLFRASPHFAKALVRRDELWVFQGMVRSSAYLQMQYFSDLEFLRELSAGMRADRKAPVYKMMHLMLVHRPTVGNENCAFDGVRPTSRKNVLVQASCGLRAVLDVFSKMKELGIYESSTIILMADHGAWVRVAPFETERKDPLVDELTVAMAIPMLAIKRSNNSEPFRISDAPTSVTDVPATIAAELELNTQFPGVNVFTVGENDRRERYHHKYFFGKNKNAPGYLNTLFEIIVDGSVYNHESWRSGEKYMPQNGLTNE